MLHLFHPALVHFSVALLMLGALCEATGLLVRREAWARAGGALLLAGVISMAPTMLTGYLAANTVVVDAMGQRALDAHEINAWLLLGIAIAALFWKGWNQGRLPDWQRVPYALFLLWVVGWTAWVALLGGDLVYGHGVGVGR